ncbi:LysR family transcriptional regulator [Rubrobacter naiadicus]|uniref:LysR family transcriptional regulator n=1 Tax=Rubrobacter naiadicus TaxID=1392641 RepID=UPI0023625DB5|nr:LysR family transcriptional regulator [Rubrobacter naiadicus]
MELRHLRYFVAVARELHFGRAAASLHIAQPSLSQQISRLEGELGVRLFERSNHRVELTEAGEALLEEAEAVLEGAHRAAEAARRAGRGERGHLEVGVVPSATDELLPAVLRRYGERFPGVSLTLQELTTPAQLEALREGRIAVGFAHPPASPAVEARVVYREPIVLALPERHPLCRETEVTLASLEREPFVLFPRAVAPMLHDRIMAGCGRAGFRPRVVQEATHLHTVANLVAGGLGLSLVPVSLQRLRGRGIEYRPLAEAGLEAEVSVIWSAKRAPGAVLRGFLNVVSEVSGRPVF